MDDIMESRRHGGGTAQALALERGLNKLLSETWQPYFLRTWRLEAASQTPGWIVWALSSLVRSLLK